MALTAGWGGISFGGASSPSPGAGTLVIRAAAPVDGATIDDTDAIYFEVASSTSAAIMLVVSVECSSSSLYELAYGGGFVTPPYANLFSEVATISDGFSVQLLRTGNWPSTPLTVRVFASDADGNVLSESLSWVVTEAVVVAPATSASVSAPAANTSDPLGFGLIRPFRRVPTNDFATASGEELVRAAVGQVLGTAIGDVPWRPRFGTRLSTLRHLRNTAALPELARISIQQALQQWEPRITITELTAEPATGANVNKVMLSLRYRINNSPESAIRVLL